MKKILAIALASALAIGATASVAAVELNQEENPNVTDTTITTSIAPKYTVSIPADTHIDFNTLSTDFGEIKLTSAQLDPGYAVQVTAKAGALENKARTSENLPYALNSKGTAFESAQYLTAGESTPLTIDITQDDWNSAYAGEYEGKVVFIVEYVEQ